MKEQIITNNRVITYKRILNLGNYEAKHLEVSEIFDADDDLEEGISRLMELVERKIREELEEGIKAEIKDAKKSLKELKKQIAECKRELPAPEDDDGIPFDSVGEIPRPTTVSPEHF